MLDINFKSNVKEFTRDLNKIQRKQIPFATARALTWTAQAAQSAIIKRIQVIFENKKKWWLKQQPTGIKIIPAKKNHLVATVYTKAHFAELQEKGGIKHPYKSKNLIIPSRKVPKSRRKSGGASIMLKSKNVFSTVRGIYRRKGGRKRKNQSIELLFTKEKTAKIKPRFEFASTAARSASAVFKRKFFSSLAKALKTAR